ncbi:MAG: RagB/SusD family nutrient uptake outer membrane protein [Niabella sp.]
MKHTITIPIYIFLAVLLTLFSCNKLLEEHAQTPAVENFYNTQAEVESAVAAIYTPLRIDAFPNYFATLECQSDYGYGRGSWAQMNEFQGLNDANTTRVGGFWTSFYLSIRNANLVIANVPDGNVLSDADKDQYIAEAKFLRAFVYFHLARNWGGVVLRTEENMNTPAVPRSSEAEVYELILSDLADAETYLPDEPASAGHPSKWTAKTLLADVYLQLKQYEAAAQKANEVIQSGKYALVPVTSTAEYISKLFGPEVTTSTEEILSLKYMRQAGQGNYMLWITNHPSTGLFPAGGAYAIYSDKTNPVYATWAASDYRKGLWDNINFGLGDNTLVSSKYQDKGAVSKDGGGTDLPLYRYSELLLLYAEAANEVNNGPTDAAMNALNQVHRRAYGYDPEAASPVDFSSGDYDKDGFLALIMQERGYEFQFEGKRWLELKRTGKAAEIISAVKNITIAEKNYLWPIPLSEMNYNTALDPVTDQNTGY